MSWLKTTFLIFIIFALIIFAVGCGETAHAANQINPVSKGNVNYIKISNLNSKGNLNQEDFTDEALIARIIDDLNNILVNRLSPAEDMKTTDNGNALKKNTAITVYLMNNNSDNPKSMVILLSDKQLYLVDVKSMQSNERTVSYLSKSDETTLKAVKDLYSLVNANVKKS